MRSRPGTVRVAPGGRGQTETLGFVLVFAIITASIGLVYATGFSGLNDARQLEQVNNAQRALEVLADNLEDITHRNAPSRSTEIKLAGAELRIGEPVELEINDPDAGFNVSYELRPVVYDAGTGTQLVYVQGAVIRAQGGDGIVAHEGTFVLDGSRTLVPVVQTRLRGEGQVSGSATVLVRADHSQTRLVYSNDSGSNTVWLNVTSPRAGVWRDHLESSYPDVTCEPTAGDTAACQITTNRVHVTLIQIDLAIE